MCRQGFPAGDLVPYILAQVAGAAAGAAAGAFVLYVIASGKDGAKPREATAGVFATNGYGATSPGGYNVVACLTAPVSQLWLFWAAPVVGAVLAGVAYPLIAGGRDEV